MGGRPGTISVTKFNISLRLTWPFDFCLPKTSMKINQEERIDIDLVCYHVRMDERVIKIRDQEVAE